MKLNQKLVAGGTAAVIAIVGVSGAAIAATSTSTTTSPQDSLIQKITDRFHLNKSDVQSVFDQNHQEMQAKHQQMLKDRLDQAVKDGELTQVQETKLLAELKTLHDETKSDNRADRRANRQAMHDKLEQWAKDNGIDLGRVMPQPGHGMGMHDAQ